jgi:hypothetical protein
MDNANVNAGDVVRVVPFVGRWQGLPVSAVTLPFGKWKSRPLPEVDTAYLRWLFKDVGVLRLNEVYGDNFGSIVSWELANREFEASRAREKQMRKRRQEAAKEFAKYGFTRRPGGKVPVVHLEPSEN